jgi:hypothetical protein
MGQEFSRTRGHIKSLSPKNEEQQGEVAMEKLNAPEHWTAESVENFTYRVASDFLAQVETKIEEGEVSRSELANRLNRTVGRVSQLFNPSNITVNSAVRLVRAAGMKVALVAYDDNDPDNQNGPVNSDLFYRCWKQMGAPKTFFELANTVAPAGQFHLGYSDQGQSAANIDTSIVDVTAMPVNRNAITRPVLN